MFQKAGDVAITKDGLPTNTEKEIKATSLFSMKRQMSLCSLVAVLSRKIQHKMIFLHYEIV